MPAVNKNFYLILAAITVVTGIVVAYSVLAQTNSASDIVFPVPELSNCKNEQECRSYCDKPANIKACVGFAEKHNLISSDEAAKAKKFAAIGKGPGGCNSKDSCDSYCNDANRINECVSFARENGLMSPEELKEAEQVQAALAKGAKLPGGCRNKNECDVYCENPDNMEQCIAFGEAAGFIPPNELADARKVLEAVKKGVKPPPCRGKQECDSYCSEPGNFKTCINFAEAAGFVSPKEAEMARKTGGKGPGDCKGKEECEAFCQSPDNQETCFNFAKEHGMIPEEDMQRMEEGKQQMMQGFNQAPPEVVDCLNSTLGGDAIEKIKSGTGMPSRETGDKMRECFEKVPRMGPPQGVGPGGPDGRPEGGPENREGMGMPEGFSGPGGCRTPEECGQLNRPKGGMMPGGVPPEEMQRQIQQMMPEGIMNREGMPSLEQIQQMMPGGAPPSPDQIQQIQGQIQEEMMQQMQPMQQPQEQFMSPPPPSEPLPPQSMNQPPTLKEFLLGLLIGLIVK